MMSFDVIVIGAGHSGMTAAALLARQGRKVLVLEASDRTGGMALGLAHVLHGLESEVVTALDLTKHGLEQGPPIPTVALAPETDPLILGQGYDGTVAGPSAEHQRNWQSLRETLSSQAATLRRFVTSVPPQPGSATGPLKAEAAKAALALRRAGKHSLREFLRMALMPAADVLAESDLDPRLAGLLAFDATLGIALGPRSPTSILGLYYRLAGQGRMTSGVAGFLAALESAARSAGCEFRFRMAVRQIMIEDGRAIGVVAHDGAELRAPLVLSAVSPVSTFGRLVGARHLDTGFARSVRAIRTSGNVSRIDLALKRRPKFPGVAEGTTRLVLAPSIDHVERSFNPSKYRELPDAPCFEAVLSATSDDAVSLSISVQNTAYSLKAGWSDGRKTLLTTVLSQLEKLCPGIGDTISSSTVLAPPDIETQWQVPGGHWHHGEWQVDRLFFNRPVFGAADYRTPIDGLFICGAGTHPGGGVNGLSGLNAAREIRRAGR